MHRLSFVKEQNIYKEVVEDSLILLKPEGKIQKEYP